MKYEPIFEDAPSPTPMEMEGSRRYQRKMSVYTGVEIIAHILILIVFPVVMVWATWWWTGTNNDPLYLRIIALIGILALSLMTAILALACVNIGGRVLIDKDLQMFHYADRPLSNLQWLEIEGLLKRHPEEIGRVSDWVAQYDGNLRHRHLWALRRAHTAHHFSLGIVETCDASGNDIREVFYDNDKDEPIHLSARDILDGRLMTFLDGHQIKQEVSLATGTGAGSAFRL